MSVLFKISSFCLRKGAIEMRNWRFCLGSGFVVMILGLMFLFACATAPPRSGFLHDYSNLKSDPEDESLLWWEKENVDWKRYKKLMIDPVVIYLHPEAQNRQIEPDVLKELTDYFRSSVIVEVQDAYPVVDKSGHDVLRIRAAITDIIPANPLINTAMILAVGLPVDMGGAAMEAEFLDSITNKPLGSVVDKKVGLPVHPVDYIQGFTKWGHAKMALDEWAELLKEALDEAHGK